MTISKYIESSPVDKVVFRRLFNVNSSFCGGFGFAAGGGMMTRGRGGREEGQQEAVVGEGCAGAGPGRVTPGGRTVPKYIGYRSRGSSEH